MRTKLGNQVGLRKRFAARVVRFGKKVNFKGYSEETILLDKVVDVESKEIVTDHIWFSFSLTFQKANPKEGDFIEFDARVKDYKKGYVNKQLGINNRKKDFKLSHPTNISISSKIGD